MHDITILFVDDESNVLEALGRHLRKKTYKRLFADSGEHALEILAKEPVHVIVADIVMPGMNGLELLREVRERHPEIMRIVLSGQTQLTQVVTAINSGEVFRYIVKPFDSAADELSTTIEAAIDQYLLKQERHDLVARLRERNRELELSDKRIVRLEGLLPICAFCKKVRNDDNYWTEVERYLEDHTELKFTHGYCPECYELIVKGKKRETSSKEPEPPE